MSIQQIKDRLNHGCDGPITPFVLISRATMLASSRTEFPENIANALDELLTEYGWLTNGLVQTGS